MIGLDGMDFAEYQEVRHAFENEGATIYLVSPHDDYMIRTSFRGGEGVDIPVDIPFETVYDLASLDILALPGGFSQEIWQQLSSCRELIERYAARRIPIVTSGGTGTVLQNLGISDERFILSDGDEDWLAENLFPALYDQQDDFVLSRIPRQIAPSL
jgi:hypothetical protein